MCYNTSFVVIVGYFTLFSLRKKRKKKGGEKKTELFLKIVAPVLNMVNNMDSRNFTPHSSPPYLTSVDANGLERSVWQSVMSWR